VVTAEAERFPELNRMIEEQAGHGVAWAVEQILEDELRPRRLVPDHVDLAMELLPSLIIGAPMKEAERGAEPLNGETWATVGQVSERGTGTNKLTVRNGLCQDHVNQPDQMRKASRPGPIRSLSGWRSAGHSSHGGSSLASVPARSWTDTKAGRWFTVALYGIVLTALCFPIFSVRVPPLSDYPNHLARMHILAAYSNSHALQANYVVAWKLTPYLAMDVIIPPLTHWMSIYTAGRVFLCACLWLFVLGTAAIHAALFRRLSLWPAASSLIAYNLLFSFGFVNYVFGVGVGLMAFAAWIVLSRHSALSRIIAGSVLSLIVFFCHFFAFFAYGLCVASYEAGVWLSSPNRRIQPLLNRIAIAGSTAVPCMALVPVAVNDQVSGLTQYGCLSEKLFAWLSPFLFPGTQIGCLTLLLATILFVAGRHLRKWAIAPPMRVPLVVIAIAVLAMPSWMSGVWGMDYRLPSILAVLMIASFSWRPAEMRAIILLSGVLLATLVADIAAIMAAWKPIGAQCDEFEAALKVITPGARVIVFYETTGTDPSIQFGPQFVYNHIPAMVVIDRDAYLPYLFKNPMEPVQAAPALKIIDTAQGPPIPLELLIESADPEQGKTLGTIGPTGVHNYWGDWPHHYDYAIELNFGATPILPPQLERLASGEMFNIYRIRP
jgi:hypothetical protein